MWAENGRDCVGDCVSVSACEILGGDVGKNVDRWYMYERDAGSRKDRVFLKAVARYHDS